MRVEIEMLGVIHCRMSILATITGVLRVGFTARRWVATTGRLVFIIAPVVTACICLVLA